VVRADAPFDDANQTVDEPAEADGIAEPLDAGDLAAVGHGAILKQAKTV
jgi:hypothetical protein